MTLTSTIGRRLATASVAIITAASGVAVTAAGAVADPNVTPTVTSLSPDSGPQAGGNEVTITGTGFSGLESVKFGDTTAPNDDDTDDTETSITVTAPAADDAGDVPVTVTTDGGTSAASTYTYEAAPAAPVITSLDPDNGPEAGGNTVTITGTDFTGASEVRFGIIPATSFEFVNDTTITAVAPADPFSAPNGFDVFVTTPAGTSATNDNTMYTYNDTTPAAPTVDTVSPNRGPAAGGTRVTIDGTGFSADSTVKFGNVTATNPSYNQNTGTITVDSPADSRPPSTGNIHRVQVTVTEGDQTSNGVTFTYGVAPAVTTIDPSTGPDSGGTNVTITGKGFTPDSSVRFGGIAADDDDVTYISSTRLEVVTPPAGFPGNNSFGVFVTTPYGTSNGDQMFSYTAQAPTVTSLSPASGPEAGGTTVTIKGTDLQGATAVNFGDVAATEFTVVDNTTITAVSPADAGDAPNDVNVTVTTPGGTSATGANSVFSYTATPVPTTLTLTPGPDSVPFGTTVTLKGTAAPGATVGIFFHVKGQDGYDQRRTLTADEDGAFSTTYIATRDQRYYAQVGTGDDAQQSDAGLTQVAPTVSGPSSRTVKRNGTAIITGRAGVDSDYVDIHFHKAGTPADDYSIVRRVAVSDNGQYTRAYTANVDYRFFVTSQNGRASDNYLYQAR